MHDGVAPMILLLLMAAVAIASSTHPDCLFTGQ
jgi:hypothetical protein